MVMGGGDGDGGVEGERGRWGNRKRASERACCQLQLSPHTHTHTDSDCRLCHLSLLMLSCIQMLKSARESDHMNIT